MSANRTRVRPGTASISSADLSGHRREAGFSLLEVLVAIVIMGVSASIVGINVGRTIESASRREVLSEVARFVDRARMESLVRSGPVLLQEFLEQDQAWAERDDIEVRFSEDARIHAHGACAEAEADVTYKNRSFVFAIAPLTCRLDPA